MAKPQQQAAGYITTKAAVAHQKLERRPASDETDVFERSPLVDARTVSSAVLVICREYRQPRRYADSQRSSLLRDYKHQRHLGAKGVSAASITNDLTSGSACNVRSCQNYPSAYRDR